MYVSGLNVVNKDTIVQCPMHSSSIEIKCYHVSCQSVRPKGMNSGKDIGGIVLYMKDGKTDWHSNGVHCRSGYVILKYTDELPKESAPDGSMVHGRVYKSVFGEWPSPSVVRSGFARQAGQWKFNSVSCNQNNKKYTDGRREMNDMEQKHVMEAVRGWIEKRRQNNDLKESVYLLADWKNWKK